MSLGDGDFGSPLSYSAGQSPEAILAVDLNQDARLDVVAVNRANGSISVFLNDGAGDLADIATYQVGPHPIAVAAADLDNDGDRDVVVTDVTESVVHILENDGLANLTTSGAFGTGMWPDGVALADLNQDSLLDICTANDGSDDISILYNVGNLVFATAVTVDVPLAPKSVAAGDLNGDGVPEIIASGVDVDESIVVLSDLGAGVFEVVESALVPGGCTELALRDIDLDNDLDVLSMCGEGRWRLHVLANDGTGSLGAPQDYWAGLQIGDVNGDGDLNAASTGNDIGAIVTYGAPGGAFVGHSAHSMVDGASGIAAGLLDDNESPDLVVPPPMSDQISIYLNDSIGNLREPAHISVPSRPRAVRLADVDGNGSMDIVIACEEADAICVLLNDGSGEFGSATQYQAAGRPVALDLADIDGDADLDCIVAHFIGSGNVSIHANQGNGSFVEIDRLEAGDELVDIQVADVNLDQSMDFVVAARSSQDVTVFIGNGTGQFVVGEQLSHRFPEAVALGDLSGDGKADLAVVSRGGPVCIFHGDGAGGFTSRAEYPINVISDLSFADLNGDSHLDIVCVGRGNGGELWVLTNTGDGLFEDPVLYTAVSAGWVDLADMDGDGDVDIVSSSASRTWGLSILWNQIMTDLPCPADLTGSSDPNDPIYGVPDGDADADDFFFYLDAFATGNMAVCDINEDTDCDAEDFFSYLDLFAAGCP